MENKRSSNSISFFLKFVFFVFHEFLSFLSNLGAPSLEGISKTYGSATYEYIYYKVIFLMMLSFVYASCRRKNIDFVFFFISSFWIHALKSLLASFILVVLIAMPAKIYAMSYMNYIGYFVITFFVLITYLQYQSRIKKLDLDILEVQ